MQGLFLFYQHGFSKEGLHHLDSLLRYCRTKTDDAFSPTRGFLLRPTSDHPKHPSKSGEEITHFWIWKDRRPGPPVKWHSWGRWHHHRDSGFYPVDTLQEKLPNVCWVKSEIPVLWWALLFARQQSRASRMQPDLWNKSPSYVRLYVLRWKAPRATVSICNFPFLKVSQNKRKVS